MTKIKILKELWEIISKNCFTDIYKDIAKQKFFKYGMRKKKKELIQTYNLYNYSYYKDQYIKLYYDIID
jgi:hypothetical protein